MGFQIDRDETDQPVLVLLCDNCQQPIIGSPDTVFMVAPRNAYVFGGQDFSIACGPGCADEVAAVYDVDDDWHRGPFVPQLAELIVRGDFLPPMVDGEAYLKLVRSVETRIAERRAAQLGEAST